MRLLLLMLGISVSIVGIGTRAEAQNYPWCAIYGGFDDGGTNCGFTTFQQCAWTPRADLAATANRIRNMFPLPDRIRRRGFKGAILTEHALA